MLQAGRSVYMLRFNGKQVTGDHVFMFGGPDLAAVCRCPCPETTYVAVCKFGAAVIFLSDVYLISSVVSYHSVFALHCEILYLWEVPPSLTLSRPERNFII